MEKTAWIRDMPLAIGKDGSIYYLADGANNSFEPLRVYAINKDDGSLKWKTEQLASSHPGSNIVVDDDGTVYIISNTKLYSIDPSTGSINWEWEVPETIIFEGNVVGSYGAAGGLALANNGDLILKTIGTGSYYRAMYCINPQGTTRWYRVIGASTINITIGSTGIIFDYEYSGNPNIHYLYAVNPDDGGVYWRTQMNYSGSGSNNIAVTDNGDLLCSIANDSLGLLNPATGEYIWKVVSQTNYKYKLIGKEGLVRFYDQWSGRHYYNISNGAEEKVIESNAGDPMTFDSNGNYYRGASQGMVCYNKDGEVIWSFNSGGSNGWTLTISNDNIIYLVSGDKVFAIQGDSPLAQSGWPRVSHDNRNTYNYSKH
ncbi:MAG: PQQ-binding-like beta-propeller repeat protein [Draconibacterium sp.]|nr:PQQ-binding-like beta-propeller repeat protein [Draconibacterium sp.]